MEEIDKKIKKLEKKKEQIRGADCEIYSRIVGYYRPVKSWNRGKSQEHKERIMFNAKKTKEAILVIQDNCPKCIPVKNWLSENSIKYKLVNAHEKPKLVKNYNIKSTPTLIINNKTLTTLEEIKEEFL